jgi:predicted small metal-binding protein
MTKLLRCTKLFGGDCEFIHKAKTVDEIIHVFTGHVADEHKDMFEKLDPKVLQEKIEKNIEEIE